MIPRQLFLGGLRDTLSVLTAESRPGQSQNPWRIAPQGVRVPGRMRAQVLALLEAGIVPLEQAAAWLRIDPRRAARAARASSAWSRRPRYLTVSLLPPALTCALPAASVAVTV